MSHESSLVKPVSDLSDGSTVENKASLPHTSPESVTPAVTGSSKRSTTEDELRSLSTTPRYSHEDLGRIVSPPSTLTTDTATPNLTNGDVSDETTPEYQQSTHPGTTNNSATASTKSHSITDGNRRGRRIRFVDVRMAEIDQKINAILMEARKTGLELAHEQEQQKSLQRSLKENENENQELTRKISALRVRLGVSNSNHNVSKSECEKMRKKFHETEIVKVRLEERLDVCNRELAKLRDPNNPESNVNLRASILADRKTIRELRSDLDGVLSKRSDVQKQTQERVEHIKALTARIGEAREQLEECRQASQAATNRLEEEKKQKAQLEKHYNEYLTEKDIFEEKMMTIQTQLNAAALGSADVQKQYEDFKEKEESLQNKIMGMERKLKDIQTEIEKEKNRNMPQRTASSIKYHQYRLFRSSLVPETTPHVVVTSNPKASLGATGFLGKTVVSTKQTKSLPGGSELKQVRNKKTSSLPSKG